MKISSLSSNEIEEQVKKPLFFIYLLTFFMEPEKKNSGKKIKGLAIKNIFFCSSSSSSSSSSLFW